MKKYLLLLILLLLLTGCTEAPVLETTPVLLPTLAAEPDAPLPTNDAFSVDSDFLLSMHGLPRLETDTRGVSRIDGPNGWVEPLTYSGTSVYCPEYGDVDGDGHVELVYLTPGPSTAIHTEAVIVFGLQNGKPVCKGSTLFYLPNAANAGEVESSLVQGYSGVCFQFRPQPEAEQDPLLESALLPVTLQDGEVLLNGGDLPQGLESLGGGYGASFSALSLRVGDAALLRNPACLIWQETHICTGSDPDLSAAESTWTYAAVTGNGSTVTGMITWIEQADGSQICIPQWIEPIEPVEEQDALWLSETKLINRFGPCHFNMSSQVSTPCWFTTDGKLLAVTPMTAAQITDLLSGEAFSPLEADTILVTLGDTPSTVQNQARWNAFLETTSRKLPDAVTIRYGSQEDDSLYLSYDGTAYTLFEQGSATCYQYLIIGTELLQQDTPSQAAYQSAIHYLLSDSQEMNSKKYWAHILSSTLDPDFPNTRLLFSIYLPER
ncbi:MAG: hypothetical protein IIY94_09185 [Oscillospiraceae bacterium]|nr:hypothetical protein [Oscillospiraceae bacterium]